MIVNDKICKCNLNLRNRVALFARDVFYFILSKIFPSFRPGASLISAIDKFEAISEVHKIQREFSWIENINGTQALVEAFNKKCTGKSSDGGCKRLYELREEYEFQLENEKRQKNVSEFNGFSRLKYSAVNN